MPEEADSVVDLASIRLTCLCTSTADDGAEVLTIRLEKTEVGQHDVYQNFEVCSIISSLLRKTSI